MLKLVIHEPEKETIEFQLEEKIYILGRDEECDIVFSDEAVSRNHAQISFENGQFFLEDLESTSGIYVNRSKAREKCSLNPDDEVLIGATKIMIEGERQEDHQQEQPDLDDEDKTKMVSSDQLQKYIAGEDRTQIIDDKTQIISNQSEAQAQLGDDKTQMLGVDEVFIPESNQTPGPDETVYIDPNEDQIITNYHKLFVISKDNFGKEYVLDQAEITLGRSQDCDITVEDETVSSSHATIHMYDDDCIITDMDSKNGTIVNKSPIREDTSLKKGDEIEIGDVKFKFVHKDAVISKEELLTEIKQTQNKKTKNRILMAAVAVFCILLFLVVISRDSEPPVKRSAVKTDQPVEDRIEPLVPQTALVVEKKPDIEEVFAKTTADIYFDTGNEFLKSRLWDEAITKFEGVRGLDPDYPGVPDGIFKARTEALNRSLLEEGLMLISQGRNKEGIKQLEGIPHESVYIDEALLEIQFARDEMKPSIPKKKVKTAEKASGKQKADMLKQKGNELIAQAMKYYTQGNTKIAITKLNSALELKLSQADSLKTKALGLKDKIQKIQETYDKGLAEYNNKQLGQAFQTWAEVINLDQEIVGKEKSHFSSRIAIYMADELYRQAREAYESGRYTKAYTNCKKALIASPVHKGCLEIQGLLAEKARKYYEEGYILEDLNPKQAIKKWKMVLGMCSPENKYYQKAKSRVAKYEFK